MVCYFNTITERVYAPADITGSEWQYPYYFAFNVMDDGDNWVYVGY